MKYEKSDLSKLKEFEEELDYNKWKLISMKEAWDQIPIASKEELIECIGIVDQITNNLKEFAYVIEKLANSKWEEIPKEIRKEIAKNYKPFQLQINALRKSTGEYMKKGKIAFQVYRF